MLCFLYQRWLDRMEDVKAREARDGRWYVLLRGLSIVGAGAISALAGISAANSQGETAGGSTVIPWILFALGIIVVTSSTIEQLAHFGQHRLLGRQALEALQSEGSKFFFRTGDYEESDGGERYSTFRRRVEAVLEKYSKDYERTISDSAASAT